MAVSKRKNILYLIPEGQTRDNHSYHYTFVKTKRLMSEGKKMRVKKYNPVTRQREWFVECKLPSHSK